VARHSHRYGYCDGIGRYLAHARPLGSFCPAQRRSIKEARSGFESFGSAPLASVSGSHALWVIGTYALVFFVLALIPAWKRDVKE
jgi:hypothetical protein